MRINTTLPSNDKLLFDSEFDIFRRREFGEHLTSLLSNTTGSAVFALDSTWGSGKTTFIRMWMNHLKTSGINYLYFDAFKNDFQKDPFFALASEIYCSPQLPDKTDFRKEVTPLLMSMVCGAADLILKSTSQGAIALEDLTNCFNGVAEHPEKYDEYLSAKLDSATRDYEAIEQFKAYLKGLNRGEKPTIYIIDELDRCRPDFALDVLEKIKHIFNVDGIVFLLVTNRRQLDEMVCTRYGVSVDRNNYLHKFVDLWLTLPSIETQYTSHMKKFVHYSLLAMADGNQFQSFEAAISLITSFAKHRNLSYREVERLLTLFAVFINAVGNIDDYHAMVLAIVICYFKMSSTDGIDAIRRKNSDDVHNLLSIERFNGNEDAYINDVSAHIIFDFSSDEIRKQMYRDGQIRGIEYRVRTIGSEEILKMMSGIC